MTLQQHNIEMGSFVTIKLPHWHEPKKAKALSIDRLHCQLHGEYYGDAILFRKYKASGKPGSMFQIDMDSEVEVIKHGKRHE